MQTWLRISALAVAVALGMVGRAGATTLVVRDPSGFVNQLEAGYHTETFDGLTTGVSLPTTTFVGGGYTFTAGAPNELFALGDGGAGVWLSTNLADDAIVFEFTAGAPRAIGINLFVTDINGLLAPSSPYILKAGLNDGTEVVISPIEAVSVQTFVGFVSDTAITRLTILVPDQTGSEILWPTVNNLILGQPRSILPPSPPTPPTPPTPPIVGVPEPSTIVGASVAGLIGLFGMARQARGRRAVTRKPV